MVDLQNRTDSNPAAIWLHRVAVAPGVAGSGPGVVSGSGRVCIWLLWLWNFVFLLLEYKLMDSSFLILFLIALMEAPYGALEM